MNDEIAKLSPQGLWENFYKLTQIPRPSKKEGKAIDFMEEFGKSLGLETIRDEVGNIIIRKPATPGYEDRMGVILQSHIDMVPQKNSDKEHNFETDPIETYIEDGWVTASGTTLGADNGIGVAAAMAVLQANDMEHGPVEALITMDEEAGMTGANALKPGILQGDILLNMDSEDEGELYVGCAGGCDANVKFTYTDAEVPADSVAFKLSMTGLKGGHSGMDIILGRGNANKLMFRFLKFAVANDEVRLASIDGGSLRNAIPREAFAVVTVPAANADEFIESLEEYEEIYKSELGSVEPFLSFTAEKTDLPSSLIDEVTQDDLINGVIAAPNGVMRMSTDMEGLTETSTNLAIVKSGNGEVIVQALMRSSVNTAIEALASKMESVFRLAGAEVSFGGQYPGWKPNMDSPILKTMQDVYQKKWGKVPEIKAIHAGLECGILGSAYPHWDMISFGPTIRFPHSPDEKVNIETVGLFWEYLAETLKSVPVKK
ncbi:aminoacyl-histidine dipeptidase [Carboxylicivirga marina]|uniref:Aminoacyl-histidine dipeptidase n=1 Tax=Carboxylicivirga marina TaxID=2800988 RepID=A0ABS1HJ93_9BACT|nr:aminoacyl-histidine dipeptidase [Carboxylicivirga marina]MBK3517742.1 aminoacyl-histidine dipeptidase [Carboxylicivirga marina]